MTRFHRPRSKAELLARISPGLRPKLSALQQRDLSLVHIVNLDAIAHGDAQPQLLWDLAESVLTWHKVAQIKRIGMPEMQQQMDVVIRLIERFQRTNRVAFDGPDYQLAKLGVDVMDELARIVDRPTAVFATDWAHLEVQRIAAGMAAIIEQEAA